MHVQRRPTTVTIRKTLVMQVDAPPRERSMSKRIRMDVIKLKSQEVNLSEDLAQDILEWRNEKPTLT